MRSILTCLTLLFLSCAVADAQWTQVGDTIGAWGVDLDMAPDGTLYTAYSNRDRAYQLRKLDDATWKYLSVPGIENSGSFPEFKIDREGVPYIAMDTFGSPRGRRLLVLKYDGQGWNAVGDASGPGFSTWGVADLVFDAENRPHVGFGLPGIVLKYADSAWQRTSIPYPGLRYGALQASPAGRIYFVERDSGVYEYVGDTTWRSLGRPGLKGPDEQNFVLTAASNGKLYLSRGSLYSRDSAWVCEYDQGQWKKLGQSFAPKTMLTRVIIGADGVVFTLSLSDHSENNNRRATLNLLHFNGARWDSSLIVSQPEIGCSHPVGDAAGNLYVAITDSNHARVMKFNTRSFLLSTGKNITAQSVSVRPNPAISEVLITNPVAAFNGREATITDLQGRLMQRFLLAPESRISTASWPAGAYFLQLPDGSVQKLLKQ